MPHLSIGPLALLGLALAGRIGTAQTRAEPVFARLQPDQSIEILSWRTGRWHRVYQARSYGTTGLSVSPAGSRLAFLTWKEGVVEGHDYTVPPASKLTAIDTTGRVLATVQQVQRYASCGASCIVYLTGRYEESHIGASTAPRTSRTVPRRARPGITVSICARGR